MNMPICRFCGGKIAYNGTWNAAKSICKKCKNSTIKGFDFNMESARGI